MRIALILLALACPSRAWLEAGPRSIGSAARFPKVVRAASREGYRHQDEIVSLGFGRSRLRFVVDERQAIPHVSDGEVKVGDLDFRELWLQRELPRIIKGIESVDVLDRVLARTGSHGTATTRERVLEVVGQDAAVAESRALIRKVVAAPESSFRVMIWIIWRSGVEEPAATPTVRLVDEVTLEQRLLEANRSDDSKVVVPASPVEVLNGRQERIEIGRRRDYVRDFNIFTAGSRIACEPVIDQIRSGIEWDFGALRIPGSDRIGIRAALRLSVLKRPIDRFRGQIGTAGQVFEIERPVVSVTSWRSDSLVLGPESVGFIVTGLRFFDPNQDGDDEKRIQEVDLVCRVSVKGLPGPAVVGVVQGFDQDTGIAFVRQAKGATSKIGERLQFLRGKRQVAVGEITEVLGGFVTVQLDEGSVKTGDEVKR